jgi:HD-GYP domain-containing protein (c-di-GMP phosphodiesterase class II)
VACDHSAFQSGAVRLLLDTSQLQMARVCDECGAECARLGTVDYFVNPRRLASDLADLTARKLRLSGEQIARVRLAALVCGMGRDQLPSAILNKHGPLTDEEWTEVRRQPELGAALLSDVSFDDIREWILCHRERPDGSGYPRGLVGEQIPLEARILAVVDAYAAMTSDRPYRSGRSHLDACRELLRCAGTQFDPAVVRAFVRGSRTRNPLFARARSSRVATHDSRTPGPAGVHPSAP